MKQIKSIFIATSLSLLASAAVAGTVKSTGSAATACKNQVKENNAEYKSSKLITTKKFKKVYRVKMKVVTEQGKSMIQCDVAKDGTVDYKII